MAMRGRREIGAEKCGGDCGMQGERKLNGGEKERVDQRGRQKRQENNGGESGKHDGGTDTERRGKIEEEEERDRKLRERRN